MKRQAYVKHKKAIEWFYSEGNEKPVIEIYVTGDKTITLEPNWTQDSDYIINDSIRDIRLAVHNGQHVQHLSAKDTWTDIVNRHPNDLPTYFIYRIVQKD